MHGWVFFADIPTTGAYDLEYFNISGGEYIAVAQHRNESSFEIDSLIYKWNDDSFDLFQRIPTNAAADWKFFEVGEEKFLALAQRYDGAQDGSDAYEEIESMVYRSRRAAGGAAKRSC